MILIALGLVFSLVGILAAVGPTSVTAIRAGRSSMETVAVRGAAEGTLASWFEGDWVDSVGRVGPGVSLQFAPIGYSGAIAVERRLEGLLPDVWLLEARAVSIDGGGQPRASVRVGWLVRIGRSPGDSVSSRRLLSRFAVDGFQ